MGKIYLNNIEDMDKYTAQKLINAAALGLMDIR